MSDRLSIGDFARITRLTVTALRHYHRVGLLEPAEVDSASSYRYYVVEQVPTALTIRRYRQLQVPVEDISALLRAPDERTRDRLLNEHLNRMRAQLQQTEHAIAALQALLTQPFGELDISWRHLDAQHAMAETDVIEREQLVVWWKAAIARVQEYAASTGPPPTVGGLFEHELFTGGRGRATVFSTVADPRLGSITVPGGSFAVAVHHGPHEMLDLTYAALGAYLTQTGEARPGVVQERYLVFKRDTPDQMRWQTEICWPAGRAPADG